MTEPFQSCEEKPNSHQPTSTGQRWTYHNTSFKEITENRNIMAISEHANHQIISSKNQKTKSIFRKKYISDLQQFWDKNKPLPKYWQGQTVNEDDPKHTNALVKTHGDSSRMNLKVYRNITYASLPRNASNQICRNFNIYQRTEPKFTANTTGN